MADGFRYDLIPPGCSVLCALSGGADSMYLLARLLEGAEQGGYCVRAAHYDHGLRPASGCDADFVRCQCLALGVPLTTGRGNVAAEAARLRRGVEETARDMRYAFLRQTAKETGCAVIATGHHAGDNAETVLMNLVRGCGLKGLSGIPLSRDDIIRPMLSLTRQEIDRFLSEQGIPHIEDESNTDPRYTRNRIRHQLLPMLEELNPKALAHINAAAARAAGDEALLSSMGEGLLAAGHTTADGFSIPAERLADAPEPLAIRALQKLVPAAGAVHLESLLALCRSGEPSARLHLPGCTARRVYGDLIFSPGEAETDPPAPLTEDSLWNGWRITCAPAICPPKAYVSPEEFFLKKGCYFIRSRREGDRLKLGPRPCKTLKDLMIEGKIPRHLRHRIPVLADTADNAAAAGGFGPHREALALPGTACLRITIKKENDHAPSC